MKTPSNLCALIVMCDLTFLVWSTPTVIPVKDFNRENDAKAIDDALKDDVKQDVLKNILTSRSCGQRMEISYAYTKLFSKYIIEPISQKTEETYEQLLKDSFVCGDMLSAVHLKRALKSSNPKSKKSITEILVTNTASAEKRTAFTEIYKKIFNCLPEDDIGRHLDGDYRNVALALATKKRQPSGPTDDAKAHEIANQLHDDRKKWEDDRVLLDNTLMETHFEQLNLIFKKFNEIAGRGLEVVIKEKLDGDKRTTYRNLIHFCQGYGNRFIGYYASRLFDTVDGGGTDEQTMIRLILLQSEIDLKEIQTEFSKAFGNRDLAGKLGTDISGPFKDLLLAYIKGNNNEQHPPK